MPNGGTVRRNPFYDSTPKPPPPMSLFGDPTTFTAAARTQASDYDRIMKDYANFASQAQTSPITSTSVTPQMVTPQTPTYRQSADVTGSLANLSNLATTGGLSAADIANIRERDISPIRSIYANAQQNVERQRALAGGYSPNFNAVQAQMARQESEQIAERTTAANAGIAQMIQQGKLAAASPYASAAGSEAERRAVADRTNAEIVNQINQANAARALQAGESNADRALRAQFGTRGNILGAIGGQASLYGTTPALTSLFGSQVMQAGNLAQQKQRDTLGAASRLI